MLLPTFGWFSTTLTVVNDHLRSDHGKDEPGVRALDYALLVARGDNAREDDA